MSSPRSVFVTDIAHSVQRVLTQRTIVDMALKTMRNGKAMG